MIKQLSISTLRQGLHEITHEIAVAVSDSRLQEGLCTVFIKHTSASLIIQENADPSAAYDLEQWLNRLVNENDQRYTHTSEGLDDMPSHIKTTLTATSVSIPVINGQLALGTWQGLFLWEHRRANMQRTVIVHTGA
ncbi:MAG: secondary thiamine-phosphate synthase enzyme YjbQ [Gammaproteobacteria bacterium]|nr:secondary thiamine-phosphate synthase enzyme YjbQ [Gammaproteobacteria bacterium]